MGPSCFFLLRDAFKDLDDEFSQAVRFRYFGDRVSKPFFPADVTRSQMCYMKSIVKKRAVTAEDYKVCPSTNVMMASTLILLGGTISGWKARLGNRSSEQRGRLAQLYDLQPYAKPDFISKSRAQWRRDVSIAGRCVHIFCFAPPSSDV